MIAKVTRMLRTTDAMTAKVMGNARVESIVGTAMLTLRMTRGAPRTAGLAIRVASVSRTRTPRLTVRTAGLIKWYTDQSTLGRWNMKEELVTWTDWPKLA